MGAMREEIHKWNTWKVCALDRASHPYWAIQFWPISMNPSMKLEPIGWVRIFKCLDDFMTVYRAQPEEGPNHVEQISRWFYSYFPGLTFSRELAADGIRFLDLELHVSRSHACWTYAQCLKELLLPFSTNHSNFVKRTHKPCSASRGQIQGGGTNLYAVFPIVLRMLRDVRKCALCFLAPQKVSYLSAKM